MRRGPRRLQVGPGGDADELVRLLPGPVQGPERRRRQDRLLRQPERRRARARSSAARASRWSPYSPNQDEALAVHQVVRAARRAEEVVGARRLLVPQGGAAGPGLRQERAVRAGVPECDGQVVRTSGPSRRYAQLLLADAEARPRLRRRRQGHGQGSARRPGRGLDRRSSRKTARSSSRARGRGRRTARAPAAPSACRTHEDCRR